MPFDSMLPAQSTSGVSSELLCIIGKPRLWSAWIFCPIEVIVLQVCHWRRQVRNGFSNCNEMFWLFLLKLFYGECFYIFWIVSYHDNAASVRCSAVVRRGHCHRLQNPVSAWGVLKCTAENVDMVTVEQSLHIFHDEKLGSKDGDLLIKMVQQRVSRIVFPAAADPTETLTRRATQQRGGPTS